MISSFGGSPFRREIGLGNATALVRLEIVWPRPNTYQTFTGVPLDASVIIREDANTFEPAMSQPWPPRRGAIIH